MVSSNSTVRYLTPSLIPDSAGSYFDYLLRSDGFISFLSSFDFHKYPQEYILDFIDFLDDPLKADLELFCLGRTVSRNRLTNRMKEFLLSLSPSGLIKSPGNSSFSMHPLCVYLVDGIIYFADIPNAMMNVYYGTDSLALLRRLHIGFTHGIRFLDLCGGAGIQGLIAAKSGAKVENVEISPISSNISLYNSTFNNLNHNYSVVNVSLESFLSNWNGHEYNRIVANPPLVPIPDEFAYNMSGHGGLDGLKITRLILSFVPRMLSHRGCCTLIGMCGGNEDGPEILDIADSVVIDSQYSATLCVFSSSEISSNSFWINYLTSSLTSYGHENIDKHSLVDIYKSNNISKIFSYSLDITRDKGCFDRITPSLQLINFPAYYSLSDGWWIY